MSKLTDRLDTIEKRLEVIEGGWNRGYPVGQSVMLGDREIFLGVKYVPINRVIQALIDNADLNYVEGTAAKVVRRTKPEHSK